MAYTATQLRAEVRRILNETTAAFYTDADIDAWIVDAVLDLSVKARCLEGAVDLTLTAGDQNYVLSDTTAIGIEAVLLDGLGLAKVRPRQFGHLNAATAGKPVAYAHFVGQLYFMPIPDTTYLTHVLYWKYSSTYTDLPEEYQLLALMYAVRQGKLKARQYAEAAQLYSWYVQEVQFARDDLQDREPDSKETLRLVDRISYNA